MNLFSLNEKKVFVLGGSGLIGTSICDHFVNYGAKVINLDLKKNKLAKIIFHKLDLKNERNIEKKLQKLIKKFGCPDVFINCSYPASKDWKNSSFLKVSHKLISSNLNLHLNSYIWTARIIAESMRKNKVRGSIIQFASIYGVVAQNHRVYRGTNIEENMIYSSIKGGIIMNVKQMASHYGKFGIRVNCISPGGIQGHVKNSKKKQSSKFVKNYSEINPLKRLAKVDEISPATIFLASDASSYITGINLVIDGGWTSI
jgi:NAD(P)-dependent dehydrogenase (short-subunit alcohol dehydrogenase family)